MCVGGGIDETDIARDVIELPAIFPFASGVIYDTISPQFQRIHWHDCLEINFIKAGTGRILINGHSVGVRQGDIVLIGSNDLHQHFNAKGLVMQTVTFEPRLLSIDERYDTEILAPFRALGKRFHHIMETTHPMIGELQGMLEFIHEEYQAEATSYTTMIRAELLRFLAVVNRYFSSHGTDDTVLLSRYQGIIQPVLSKMETQVEHPWTLKELADSLHLSQSRFSAVFHEAMGMAPLEYLIHLRLTKAISLLRETDWKIVDIAWACGFRNLSNFHRLFQKHIGQSPRQIRHPDCPSRRTRR